MLIETYDRKPFSVQAVQVTFSNVQEVAEWCKGKVIIQKTKLLGVETDVPAIQLDGQGDNRGKSFIASLNCYVVELKGSFRVYKPAQFDASFEKAVEVEHLLEDVDVQLVSADGCSECTNEAEHERHMGLVGGTLPAYQLQDDGITAKPVDSAL